MRTFFVIILSLGAISSLFSQITFNLNSLCIEAEILDSLETSKETANDFEFILNKVIPALSTYTRNDEIDNYLELINCTRIKNKIYKFHFFKNNEINLLKQDAKYKFEKTHLLFTRTHLPEQWLAFFYKRILSDMNLINIAIQLSGNTSKHFKTDRNHQVNELKTEIIIDLKEEIKFASTKCDSFNEAQLLVYNNFITSLSEVKPQLQVFSCN